MGREAHCDCTWGDRQSAAQAKLESGELILRGAMRKRVAFGDMEQLRADGGKLCFTVCGEQVSLALGDSAAAKWASAIANPPTLARKLGITAKTRVWMLGDVDDDALRLALDEAAGVSAIDSNLIVARADAPEALDAVLRNTAKQRALGVPLWIVYPKGSGQALSESAVIASGRAAEMTDTKVAAVSARLTALRFVKRR